GRSCASPRLPTRVSLRGSGHFGAASLPASALALPSLAPPLGGAADVTSERLTAASEPLSTNKPISIDRSRPGCQLRVDARSIVHPPSGRFSRYAVPCTRIEFSHAPGCPSTGERQTIQPRRTLPGPCCFWD